MMMNVRFTTLLAAALLLSGCSTVNSLLTYDQEYAPAPEAQISVAQPAPAAGGINEWCQRVAASDRLRAQESGFDAATLDRMTVQSYRQCAEFVSR